jgi:hypothetical protein
MMTLLRRRWPLLAWSGVLALGLWMAGCGPGVGGTGTDSVSDAFAAFGAQPSPSCPLCAAAPTTGASDRTRMWLELPGARVAVRYQDTQVTLDERCAQRRFTGEWGTTAAGRARYYGVYAEAGRSDGLAAALAVTLTPDGRQSVELRDLMDVLLLGPLTLQPASEPLPGASCP